MNQIAGDLPGVGWQEEMIRAFEIAEEALGDPNYLGAHRTRDERDIPPLPPGGPPWSEVTPPIGPVEGNGVDAAPTAIYAETGTLDAQMEDSGSEPDI